MSAADRKDDHRHIGGRQQNVGAAFAAEAPSLAALPGEAFDASTIVTARVGAKARVAVRACHYSVPARLAGRRVEVAIGGMTITFREHGTIVAVRQGFGNYWANLWSGDDIFYATVAGFKGLERPAVVVAIDGFRDGVNPREVLYVAMSRARDKLIVVGDPVELRKVGLEFTSDHGIRLIV